MRIATFNANSIRSRLEAVTNWMSEHHPDVLCLQETKVQDHDFPKDALESLGYHVAFKGEKSYNGVAILSREPLTKVGYGFDDGGPADESRFIYAEVAGVTVVNTYVPQGREIDHPMYPYKIEWFARLRKWFSAHCSPGKLVVWTGDLNVARDPIDVYEPEKKTRHVCYHEDVRKAFDECRAWGFVDVFREYHPEPGQYTFYDYRAPNAAKRGIGWRIDYILASKPLARLSRDSFIDLKPRLQPKPSDHTFLVADFGV